LRFQFQNPLLFNFNVCRYHEDGTGAYRLLATASRALSTMRSGGLAGAGGAGGGSPGGDDATLTLVHAALGPLVGLDKLNSVYPQL
jgi:hypothetical protein